MEGGVRRSSRIAAAAARGGGGAKRSRTPEDEEDVIAGGHAEVAHRAKKQRRGAARHGRVIAAAAAAPPAAAAAAGEGAAALAAAEEQLPLRNVANTQPAGKRAGKPAAAAAAAAEAKAGAPAATDDDRGPAGDGAAAGAAPRQRRRRPPPPKKRKQPSAAAAGPSRAAEQRLWARGCGAVAGVDEAGRGPLAGPVVAAAAILPRDAEFPGLNDSKQMSEEERERLYAQLTSHPGVVYSVSVVGHETIDEVNILQAAMLAMTRAVEGLAVAPDHLLIDGNRKPKGLEHVPADLLVKGDATSTCISAASVIAKVTRDRLMQELDKQYPQYGFGQHKGYGVPAHKEAIWRHGPSPVHRRSFEPVKSMTGWAGYGQKAKAVEAAEAAAAATAAAAAAQQQQQQEQQPQQRHAQERRCLVPAG